MSQNQILLLMSKDTPFLTLMHLPYLTGKMASACSVCTVFSVTTTIVGIAIMYSVFTVSQRLYTFCLIDCLSGIAILQMTYRDVKIPPEVMKLVRAQFESELSQSDTEIFSLNHHAIGPSFNPFALKPFGSNPRR